MSRFAPPRSLFSPLETRPLRVEIRYEQSSAPNRGIAPRLSWSSTVRRLLTNRRRKDVATERAVVIRLQSGLAVWDFGRFRSRYGGRTSGRNDG